MYRFIFYFIYKWKYAKEGYALTRYSSCIIVTVAIGIHINFFYALLRFLLCYFKNISISRTNTSLSLSQQFLLFLIILGIFISTCLYFTSKRIARIAGLYNGVENFYSVKNKIAFLLIFIMPLLIGIYLVNKSLGFCS